MTDLPPDLIDDGGDHPVAPWLNQRRRAWLYRVILAAVPLLTVLGALTEAVAWPAAGLVLALIGTGTAVVNTSTKP